MKSITQLMISSALLVCTTEAMKIPDSEAIKSYQPQQDEIPFPVLQVYTHDKNNTDYSFPIQSEADLQKNFQWKKIKT